MDDCSSAKVNMLNTILISIGQLFLSVIRLCVAPRTDTA